LIACDISGQLDQVAVSCRSRHLTKLSNNAWVASANEANLQIRIFLCQAAPSLHQQIDTLISFNSANEDDGGPLVFLNWRWLEQRRVYSRVHDRYRFNVQFVVPRAPLC